MLLNMIGYSATAPSTGAAAAAVAGDSLTVRLTAAQKAARIVAWWSRNQTSGSHQIIYPTGHDTTRGIRAAAIAAVSVNSIARGAWLDINPQEVMSVSIVGSGTAGDIENGVIGLWYDDVPGLEARLITSDQLRSRMVRQTTVQATISTGTAGGWSGSEAINAETDLLRANTDYAVLGAVSSVASCALGITAPDFGNVRVAVPGGITAGEIGPDWLVQMSDWLGSPTIPVFNSANRGNVTIDALQDENGADPIVTWFLAELK